MEAPERGALMLVRFIAAALISWAVVDLSLYLAIARHNYTPVNVLPCVFKSIPAVIGVVLLVKARNIAEWISNKFDE